MEAYYSLYIYYEPLLKYCEIIKSIRWQSGCFLKVDCFLPRPGLYDVDFFPYLFEI